MRLLFLLLACWCAAAPAPRRADPDQAQKALEAAVRADATDAAAWRLLALVYEKKGMRDQALTAWKSCLTTAPDEVTKEQARRHIAHLEALGAR
jgi:cytochrome c-type biogenesis protein CcmH/NrfG